MTRARWTVERIRALADDAPPLADLLPWRWVEDDHVPLHVLADGSLGLAWELAPADVELAEAGDRLRARTAVEHFLHQLPPNVAFQVIVTAVPGADEAVRRWRLARLPSPLAERVVRARERHLAALAHDPTFAVKTLGYWLTLRWWPPYRRGLPRTGLLPWESLRRARALKREAGEHLTRLVEAVRTLAAALGVEAAPVGADRFLALAWRLLNPDSPGAPPPADRRRPLHEQATESDAVFRPDGFRIGGLEGSVVVVHRLPEQTWPGMLSLGREPGEPSPLLTQAGWGWVAVCGTVLDAVRAQASVERKRQLAWTQRFGLLGSTRVEAERIYQELGEVIDQAFSAGLRLCTATFLVVQVDRAERVPQRTSATLDALARLGCRAQAERSIALPLWLASLPFGYDPLLDPRARRARRLLSRNLADLLPLYGGWRGTATPAQLFLSREGAPLYFDPFDSPVGAHIAMSGITGSGKSFTAIDLILQQLSLGADVVVLDKGDSYRRLAELMGGRYLALDPATMPTFNPCYGPGDDEHQRFVVNLLAEMASRGLERFTLDPEMDGVLASAVAAAWARAGEGREVVLSDIAARLEDAAVDAAGLGARLRRMLFPFLRGGQAGRYFDGPNGFRLEPGLTVIELKDLEKDPALQRVVMMVLLYLITTFFRERPRDCRKFLVVDEAWALVKSEYAARILELVARTYRKLGTCGVFISQFLSDFDGPAGRAIVDNCPNRIFLRQELDTLRRLQAVLGFSDVQVQALASATSVVGRYAEALVVTPAGRRLVRIVPDRATYWVATTHPADLGRWQRALEEAGGRPDVAFDTLLASEVHAP